MTPSFELLYQGHHLSETDAYTLLESIYKNDLNPTKIAVVIAFYMARPITVHELSGFRKALLDACIPVKLDRPAIDVCGTGGDQKNTFNISTLSAIVLAAAGVTVAKHGNYGSSSVSGSSDILQYLGYRFKSKPDELCRELDTYNVCFIHAPLFHPALKQVATQRKELGKRTFFNMLGPLVNPANVSHRYIGVYDLEIARLYHYLLQQDQAAYSIVHSLDGYDEVSLTSGFKQISKSGERVARPADLGFATIAPESIYGGSTLKEAAEIFMNVLKNKSTEEQKNVVIANSALAMNCYCPELSQDECLGCCRESIESKKALHLFKRLISN